MSLTRQYAIRRLSNADIKNILKFFNCDLTKNLTLKNVIEEINNNLAINKNTEQININLQHLQSLYFTNPTILNVNISNIN